MELRVISWKEWVDLRLSYPDSEELGLFLFFNNRPSGNRQNDLIALLQSNELIEEVLVQSAFNPSIAHREYVYTEKGLQLARQIQEYYGTLLEQIKKIS